MSEEKRTARPTAVEARTAQMTTESVPVSPTERTGGRADARSADSPGKREVVAVRLSTAELADLDAVRGQLGGSRSDALRASVVSVARAFDSGSIDKIENHLARAVAAKRPRLIAVDAGLLAGVRDALSKVSDRYAQQSFQLQRIGNNWGQIMKVVNAGGDVDADAIRGVQRALNRLGDVMQRAAERDADIATKLREAL